MIPFTHGTLEPPRDPIQRPSSYDDADLQINAMSAERQGWWTHSEGGVCVCVRAVLPAVTGGEGKGSAPLQRPIASFR